MTRPATQYMDPYLAGIGIGLVILTAWLLVGRGLGASGAFSSVVAAATAASEGSGHALTSPALAPYLPQGTKSPLQDWLVLELMGVAVGGFFSAWRAGRLQITVEKGPRIGVVGRMTIAAVGGGLMGFGAKLARGCTSGQALTGGALLSVGSWVFVLTCFAAAYALSPLTRRLWR